MKDPGPRAVQSVIDRLIRAGQGGWRAPEEPFTAPRADEQDHEWELRAWKADNSTTLFLWHCERCGRGVTTETASRDAPFFADQSTPSSKEMAELGISADCRQSMVDMVHDL